MTSITINGHDLHAAVSLAARAIPSRVRVPILSGVLVETGEDRITVSAFDYDTRVTATAPAVITSPGRFVVSGRLLSSISRAVDASPIIDITHDGGSVTVREGRSEWTLPVMPIEEYPQLPELGEKIGTVTAGHLRDVVSRVVFAAARDDTIPMLTAVKIESSGRFLDLAATDRFRLSTDTVTWEPEGEQSLDELVPAKLLEHAVKGFRLDTDPVAIHRSDGGIGFATDNFVITARCLAEKFPPWRRLIPDPDQATTSVVVDTGALLDAAGRAALAAGDLQRIRIHIGDGSAEITAVDEDTRSRVELPLIEHTGESITVGVNCAYVREGVAHAPGGKVRIVFTAPNRPVLITPVDSDTAYRHLVMPLRLVGGEP